MLLLLLLLPFARIGFFSEAIKARLVGGVWGQTITTRGETRVAGRVGWDVVGVGDSVFSLLELACLA